MPTLMERMRKMFPKASGTTLREMLEEGRVWVNGRRARSLKAAVSDGDTVEVRPRGPRRGTGESVEPLRLVHADDDLVVVEKPPGLLTSTVPGESRPTAAAILRRWAAARDPRLRVGVIHRLDQDASGLLVFTLTHAAYRDLKRRLRERRLSRVYHALVHGAPQPAEGTIRSKLVESADGTVRPARGDEEGQLAVTRFTTLRAGGEVSLIRLELETGRKHQIRVQCAQRGFAVVGDRLYGPRPPRGRRLMLCATRLAFGHPRTGEKLVFEIDPPADMLRPFKGS